MSVIFCVSGELCFAERVWFLARLQCRSRSAPLSARQAVLFLHNRCNIPNLNFSLVVTREKTLRSQCPVNLLDRLVQLQVIGLYGIIQIQSLLLASMIDV